MTNRWGFGEFTCTEAVQVVRHGDRPGASCDYCHWWHRLTVRVPLSYTSETGVRHDEPVTMRELSTEELQALHDKPRWMRPPRRPAQDPPSLPKHLRPEP